MSEEILEKYCQFILNKYEHIRSLDEHVTLTMKDYMPLQLGEERERLVDKRRDERGDRKEYHEDFRVWREEHTAHKGYSITPVEVWKAVKNKKIVVKGDPGSGKTTLTQYIAYTLCTQRLKDKTGSSQDSTPRTIPTDLLPLVIDLKDWAGNSLSVSEYYIRHVLKDSGLEKEIKLLIDEWLTSGRCIILFDGLDEVTNERNFLINSVQNLTSGVYRNCHFVVTTRIVGYGNELSGWQHYEVMSLRDEHINNYVQSYLRDTSSDFLTALKNTPQMSPFSKNPLLLHVLCFVFKKQRLILPIQRIELYHQAVHELLKLRNPEIPESIKENALKEIAIYFLEGKEIFEEDFLRKILRDFLKKEGESYNEDDVLREIVEKSGLLCRFGDWYIFLHLTFQEYMAACYVAEKIEKPSQFLEPVLFNPTFREVIRHTAGMLGSAEDIIQFVEFILEQKPLCHDILHQPLLLAGLCIADIPDTKVDSELREIGKRILDKLWRFWKVTLYDHLQNEINMVFVSCALNKCTDIVINKLLDALKDEDSFVRWNAAEALGEMGHANPEVIQALLKALRDADSSISSDAVRVLGKLGCADDTVIKVLLGALKDRDSSVRKYSVEALGELGRVDDTVIEALLGALKDADSLVKGNAAEALAKLGRADDTVIRTLLGGLKHGYAFVYWDAAGALSKPGRVDDTIIKVLLGALKDADSSVRSDAVRVLGKLGRVDSMVIKVLLGALEDADSSVKGNAAEALGELGHVDDAVIEALLGALKDADSSVKGNAAEALAKLGRVDDTIIKVLLGALKDADSSVRFEAVRILGKLGRADDTVIKALLGALKDGDLLVSSDAVRVLGKFGRVDDTVIKVLLGALKDRDSSVREYAVEALGELGHVDDAVIEALLGALKDADSSVKGNAAEALAKLGRADDTVIEALLGTLKDEDSFVRWNAAKALGGFGRADDPVIDVSLDLLKITYLVTKDFVIPAKNVVYLLLQKLVRIRLSKGSVILHSQIYQTPNNSFSQEKEDIIKKLTRKFPVYLNRTPPNITENDIREWFLQFEETPQRDLAITLLENIDYYRPERMKEAFCHFCDNILQKDEQSKVIISLLGSLKDSSSIVNYTIAKEFMDRNMESLPLETILENMNPREKVIVFVDDIIGSGLQANVIKLRNRFIRKSKDFFVWLNISWKFSSLSYRRIVFNK